MHLRTTKTKSHATAVQVVRYERGKTLVVKHVGSAKDPQEISNLKKKANDWITRCTGQQSFFTADPAFDPLFGTYRYLGVRYHFLYEILSRVLSLFDFETLKDKLLLDLVLARIVEPASKLRSVKLLSELFGIDYDITTVYRHLRTVALFKDRVEEHLVSFARQNLAFDFTFVLYDVTTLYFESCTDDELRKHGFSKDNRSDQPQIVVGLLVNKDGFPLSFSVFPGNKFEGHTLLPVISGLREKYHISTITVVADSAMISADNIQALKKAHVNFIVGARLGYLDLATVVTVSQQLDEKDKATLRLPMDDGFLVCDFSAKRQAKDKRDTEKQIEKAKLVLTGKVVPKKLKFLTGKKTNLSLNQKLIDRTKLLWGVKGYHTDLSLPDVLIIARYHDLWNIEKSFRISKSDLLVRPVFHFKKEAIEAHLLICVMALAVVKFMELKTGKSMRVIREALKKITEARIVNIATNEEALWRVEISEEVKLILETIGLTY